MKKKTLKGHVVKQPYAVHSKSEHNAVCLQESRGGSYRLQIIDGEAFSDPRLEQLVGKDIVATGKVVHGNTFVISTWKELTKNH